MPAMARTRIKICGVRDAPTALAAADAGADAVGLVFAQGSPRLVTVEQARAVMAALPPYVTAVGVFVDAPVDDVRRIASDVGLNTVQLHGRETPNDVAALAPLRVVKALAFDANQVSDAVSPWRAKLANLAGLLWDAAPPAGRTGAAMTGGHGRAFDWSALAAMQRDGALADLPPMILAGGLTPDNVADAITTLRPFAVDVSTGVETSPGVKAPQHIATFCAAVRAADG